MTRPDDTPTQSAVDNVTPSLPVPTTTGRESIPTPVADTLETLGDEPSPIGRQSRDNLEAHARFADEVHQYIREYIRLADQKAIFLFTGATALLAFLYKNGVSREWLKPPMQWNVLDMAAFVSMTGLAIGALLSLFVVSPRVTGSRRGYLFWDAIAEYSSARDYADALACLSPASLVQIKAEHCFDLAKVSRSKYRVLLMALRVCGVGLAASLIVFLFGISASL